jgi:hypothetical protein
MADIFISYAKADHDLAAKLAAVLGAEGWTVWWDKSLTSGDPYRDEIMKQLAAARAVITIWTATSIKSDWVRAEAGRAKADGKLIPVKTRALTYADIPLPFGEMHTENVDAPELIKAAIVAQLAKPTVEPSRVWLMTRMFRLHLLTWGGIVGGAVTLFANLRGFFTMADWVRWLLAGWLDWMHAFWALVLGWIGLSAPRDVAPILSFAAFVTMLVIATRLRDRAELAAFGKDYTLARGLLRLAIWAAIYIVVFICCGFLTVFAGTASWVFYFLVFIVGLPALALLSRPRQRLQGLASTAFYLIFSAIIGWVPFVRAADQHSFAATGLLLLVIPPGAMAIASFVPLRAINKRLLFLFIGLLLLLALNQVSNLHLDQYVVSPKAPT